MKQNFTVRQGALDGVEAALSVAQHRSFRRAAAELGVTPSAISQAVRVLEARVGAALFIRTPPGAAGGGADPAGAADRVVLPSLSRCRGGDRRKRGSGRYRCRRI